jgi:hypothetical protein
MSVTPLVVGKSCTLLRLLPSMTFRDRELIITDYFEVLKMGLFSKIPSPASEVYTRNRQEWEPPIGSAKQVDGAR